MNSLFFFEHLKKEAKSKKQIEIKHDSGFMMVNNHVLLETGWFEIDEWRGLFGVILYNGTKKDREIFNNNTKNKQKVPTNKKEMYLFLKSNKKTAKTLRFLRYGGLNSNKDHQNKMKILKKSGVSTLRLTKKKYEKRVIKFVTSFFYKEGIKEIYVPKSCNVDYDFEKGSLIQQHSNIETQIKQILGVKELSVEIKRQIDYIIDEEKNDEVRQANP